LGEGYVFEIEEDFQLIVYKPPVSEIGADEFKETPTQPAD